MRKIFYSGLFAAAATLMTPVASCAENAAAETDLTVSAQSVEQHQQHPLQAYVNQLKTFQADFNQEVPENDLLGSVSQTGRFALQRPGQLRWEYTQPAGQKILVDGKNIWVYDEDLAQLTVRPLAEIQADIPLSWLLFDEKIEQRFDILAAGNRNGMQWYNLQPKAATYFQSIEVGLKNGQMVEVWMYESMDTVTKVRFSNIRSNQPLNANTFRMIVPKGTDVVGSTAE